MIKIVKKKKNIIAKLNTEWPKYTSSLMNLANGVGNKTSKKNIGPLFEYFQEFKNETNHNGALYTIENWAKFYKEKYNGENLIKNAVEKNLKTIEDYKKALSIINKEMLTNYIEDLVFKKTFIGMDSEGNVANIFAIWAKINLSRVQKSSSKDESNGIDYWVGDIPIQVKPWKSYKGNSQNVVKNGLTIYYTIRKDEANNKSDEIEITFDEEKYNYLSGKSENNS